MLAYCQLLQYFSHFSLQPMTKISMLILLVLTCLSVGAQQAPYGGDSTAIARISGIPEKYMEKIGSEQEKISKKILRMNQRTVRRMEAQEKKLYTQLARIDSLKAHELFAGVSDKYQSVRQKVEAPTSIIGEGKVRQYIPRMDSLTGMLKFLQPTDGAGGAVEKALAKVGEVKEMLSRSVDIKTFLEERQEMLKNITGQFTNLPVSVTKSFNRYGKELYYYKERLTGLRETLNDPKKTEELALKALNQIPAFQQFMQQNGELAQLFGQGVPAGAPANGGVSLAGLQTRASVQQLLQQQFGATGINPQQYIQQQVGAAQAELGKLKQKLEGLKSGGAGNGDSDMPDFKPSTQKAKPFLKRLEYGWNLQTGNRAGYSFPSSNDVGASIGYKFNDRLVAGAGIAYKFGLGSGWNKIAFTSDGIGIRSYVDFKISSPQKGVRALFSNIWMSGGYEQNYWAKFKNIPELRKVAWQTSGLVGISKKIQYRKKEAKVSVLWDFLADHARGKVLVIRTGMNF